MSTLAMIVFALAAFVAGSLAVSSEIMPPMRPKGDELALILVPGANIKGEAYRQTARAMQQGSPLRVWVALTGNYTKDVPNPKELEVAVAGAIKSLKAAGMTSTNYVGVGHSLGGIILGSYAKKSPLSAVVLLGAYIARPTKLRDYPKPVLTLSGELDGQTRITRIALDFEQLQEAVAKNASELYRTPVLNIKGACHAQFASGPMPPEVKKYDIEPAITEQQAHDTIGRYVSHFLAFTFSTAQSKVKQAKLELEHDIKESTVRFQPLLNMKSLDVAGKGSPWAQMSQGKFAGKYASSTTINNKILDKAGFQRSKPTIVKLGKGVVVNTTALLEYEPNPKDIAVNKESPREVDIKMVSEDEIKKVLNVSESNSFDEFEAGKHSKPTCKSLNEEAFKLALQNSTTQSQERYRRRGRPLKFIDDVVFGTEKQWSGTPLKMVEDDKALHVQAVAFYTNATTNAELPGMHYCKVISPYRAMEWINVDSLRRHKP